MDFASKWAYINEEDEDEEEVEEQAMFEAFDSPAISAPLPNVAQPMGMFGAPGSAPQPQSLFGAPGSAAQPSSGFGAPGNVAQPPSLFGAPGNASQQSCLFGAPGNAPQPSSLFGAPGHAPQQMGLFGAADEQDRQQRQSASQAAIPPPLFGAPLAQTGSIPPPPYMAPSIPPPSFGAPMAQPGSIPRPNIPPPPNFSQSMAPPGGFPTPPPPPQIDASSARPQPPFPSMAPSGLFPPQMPAGLLSQQPSGFPGQRPSGLPPQPGCVMPPPPQIPRRVHKQRVDTNVVEVKLNCLSSEAEIATGDAVFCANCKVILNSNSKLIPKPDPSEYLWLCEFCEANNEVNIEEEEIPKSDEITYILENPEYEEMKVEDDFYVIFCIDISGSMCVTKPVSSNMKLKTNRLAELQKLATREDGDQWYPGQQRGQVYISRLECVQAAIEQQITQMAKTTPNVKVGLVVFNNEVKIIGDGVCAAETLAGDKLNSLEKCCSIGEKHKTLLNGSVGECSDGLLKSLLSLEETGATALGPALAASVALATKGRAGSKVIVCTDGLANVGVGAFEGLNEDQVEEMEIFYTGIGTQAQETGTTVSIVSIEGEECKLEYLSSIASITGGDVTKVDPERIHEDFANILSEELIATESKVTVSLHKSLAFRNEEAEELSMNESRLTRNLGNITSERAFTFEYQLKPKETLAREGIDLSNLTSIPFQVQIEYKSLTGMRCTRVISKIQQKTANKSQAQEEAKFDVLQKNVKIKTAKLADQGNYEAAQISSVAWRNNMARNVQSEEQARSLGSYVSSMSPMYGGIQMQRASEQERQVDHAVGSVAQARDRRAHRADNLTSNIKHFSKHG